MSYFKNYICKFIQTNSWHLDYSTFVCPFESGKCEKVGGKLQKFEYLDNKNSFLDETEEIFFVVFKGLLFGEIIKIW